MPYLLVLSTNVCESGFVRQSVSNETYLQRYDGAHEQARRVELLLDLETEVSLPHEIIQLFMSLFDHGTSARQNLKGGGGERLTVRVSNDLFPGISAGSATSTMNLLGTVFLNPVVVRGMVDEENFAANVTPARAAETRAEVAVRTMLGNHWQAAQTSTRCVQHTASAL